VSHETEEGVGTTPLSIVLEANGGEDRKAINDAAKSTAKNEGLKVGGDGFPLVIVRIRKSSQGEDIGEETMSGRKAIVGQRWNRRQHGEVAVTLGYAKRRNMRVRKQR